MIKFEGVSHTISGPSGSSLILDDIDFFLERGETVALMGTNGSGKSTMCRCVNGLLLPGSGSVRVDGLSTGDARSSLEIKRRVGMVFQDPAQQLVTWSVEEEIAFGLENIGTPREIIEAAVRNGLTRWGLDGLQGRHPRHLSGGQMVAVAIASVMAMGPSYLVVDEASSLLDRRGRRRLAQALEEIRKGGDMGVLWVTQYPHEAALCDRLVIINRGRIVADGPPGDLLSRPSDLRGWGLEPTVSVAMSHHLMSLGLALSRLHVSAGPLAMELQSIGMAGSAPGRPPPPTSKSGYMLRMTGAGYGYDEGYPVLSNVNLHLRSGEALGLAGPSGSGKSTLALLASEAIAPTVGVVDRPCSGLTKPPVGICAQFPEEQFCTSTVAGEVALGLPGQGIRPRASRARVEELLNMVGLDGGDFAERSPLGLSEGEKKKVALASALSREGSILVLDEPTQGLDGPSSEQILLAIRAHVEAGGGALVVSDSGDFLIRTTNHLLVLEGNSESAEVTWEEALRRYDRWEALPEGHLLELFCRITATPPFEALGSLGSIARWLAGLLASSGRPERERM